MTGKGSYCSRRCKDEAYNRAHPVVRQQRLDFTPAASELAHALRNRETRAQKMLARLRLGPASTFDLMMLGGAGFSSRLKELRRAGHEIEVSGGPERFVYTLKKA